MAAIQQWWLGLARKRPIVVIPGVQYLVNWFLGSGSLEATLQDGTLDNDYGTWVVDEANYLDPEPGYSTYTSTNTSPDDMVLTNTGGSKIVMEVIFNVDGSFGPGSRPVEFQAYTVDGSVGMIGAEGTSGGMPGQIVFDCYQTSGAGDGPNWTPTPGQDYWVVLEWTADEGPSGTARWFIDGEEWGISTTIGEVDELDAATLQSVTYVANHGATYYANLYSTPGPGFNPLDWQALNTGIIGGTPAPTGTDYEQFGHNGSHYGVTVTNGFGNAQSNYTYSARAGFPSQGVEFRLDAVQFTAGLGSRCGLIHHDVNNDGWAFDVGIDVFVTNGRQIYITKWDGGSGLGVLFFDFTVGTASRDLRAHIGNNEARLYVDDVLVAYGPHLTEEANFSSSVRNVIFSAARFAGGEIATIESARVRDLAYPNPGTVVSADYSLSAGYEAAYTAVDAAWEYWPGVSSIANQGTSTRTMTSNDISFDGVGFISLTPEGDTGLLYESDTVNIGTDPGRVMEYKVRSIAAGAKVAVGVYAPGVGPPPDFDQYLAGFSSGSAYYESNGFINGYGGVNSGTYESYGPGDVISCLVSATANQVQFFKNGVAQGLPVSLINSTVSVMVSVGTE